MFTWGYRSVFSSILRALSAIGIGAIMVISNNATVLVVKIIAAFLFAAGVVSLAYGIANRKNGTLSLMVVNALADMLIGLLLYLFPTQVAGFIVNIIGIVVVLLAALQMIVLLATWSFAGRPATFLILSILALIGGVFLIFNPFTMKIMSIIAGLILIMYGVTELMSGRRVKKAKDEYDIKYGPGQARNQSDNQYSDLSGAKDVEFHKEN